MYTVYENEKVRIRPFESAEEWQYIIAQDIREPNEHWGPWHWPMQNAKEEFEKTGLLSTDKYSCFAIECVKTGELVGLEEFGALSVTKLGTWIGTFVRPEFRKQGFGFTAKQLCLCYLFEQHPINLVFADTTQTHKDARRGLELTGMKYLGARRKAHFYKGRYVDVVLYAIKRKEWEALPIRASVVRS